MLVGRGVASRGEEIFMREMLWCLQGKELPFLGELFRSDNTQGKEMPQRGRREVSFTGRSWGLTLGG